MEILNHIPHWQRFLHVSEIDDYIYQLCRNKHAHCFTAGKSTKGHRILGIRIGSGKKNALMFGFPHTNEPIGSLTALSWAQILLENQKLGNNYTWYIIPCIDPDGARLNEGWFTPRFDIKTYLLQSYRSAPSIQVDWAFPYHYKKFHWTKTVRESRALMKLITRTKPEIIYPLHNAGITGAYYYLSHDLGTKKYTQLYKLLSNLGIPLHKGSPELPYLKTFAPSIYKLFGPQEEYDYIKKTGGDPLKVLNQGTDSINYAQQHNKKVFGMITELPYLTDPRIDDTRPSKLTQKQTTLNECDDKRRVHTCINTTFKKLNTHLNKTSPFYNIIAEYLPYEIGMIKSCKQETQTNPEMKQQATIAQEIDSTALIYFYNSTIIGTLIRLLNDSPQTPPIKQARTKTLALLEKRIKLLHTKSRIQALPIRNLVQAQIGSMLILTIGNNLNFRIFQKRK